MRPRALLCNPCSQKKTNSPKQIPDPCCPSRTHPQSQGIRVLSNRSIPGSLRPSPLVRGAVHELLEDQHPFREALTAMELHDCRAWLQPDVMVFGMSHAKKKESGELLERRVLWCFFRIMGTSEWSKAKRSGKCQEQSEVRACRMPHRRTSAFQRFIIGEWFSQFRVMRSFRYDPQISR